MALALPAVSSSAIEPTLSEAFQILLSSSRRKTGRMPTEALVRHALSVTAGAEWPVKRAAMDALLRRLAFARRDGLRVASRPPGRASFGHYTTRRARSRERPYATWLESVDPIRGSCECPDFLRNSLAACKHVLAIVADLGDRKRTIEGARPSSGETVLGWDPVRPLTGAGDPLERLRLVSGRAPVGAALKVVTDKWMRREEAAWILKSAHAAQPSERLEMVEELYKLAKTPDSPRLRVEPAARALLEQERERLTRVQSAAATGRESKQALKTLRRRLYPYQTEGVTRFLTSGRLLLADDMGLGKTAQAIAASHVLFESGRVRRGLIIVPASLKDQWHREWEAFTATPVAVVDGTPEERRAMYRRHRRGFLIANYEQVLRDLDAMQDWQPDLVVLDEAQRIKNWATKTAAYVKALRPAHRLVLTGTPMENRLEELASILEWVDDQALEPKWRLAPLHASHDGGSPGTTGARHLDTLRARLAPSLMRRVRAEVLTQLPGRTDTVVPVAFTAEQAEEHAALDPSIARLAASARKRPLTQPEFLQLMSLLTKQRIIANGLAQLRFEEVWPAIRNQRPHDSVLATLSAPKLAELREILTQVVVEQGRKVVVFSQWHRMVVLAHWATSDLLRRAGGRAAFFTGRESQRQRTRSLVDFHDDPAVRVLFATDAGGVGLNLQRAASCCVNLELPWNPAVLEQRIGRIYRLGQRSPIDVYNLVTEGSIESRIAGIVSDKKAFFTGLFDGDSNEVRFDRSSSFLSRLERIIEPAQAPERRLTLVADPEDEAESVAATEQESGAEANESADTVATEESPSPAAAPAAEDVRRLFASLAIRPRPDGGVQIDAPPEAAAGLAALFEGMAALLRG